MEFPVDEANLRIRIRPVFWSARDWPEQNYVESFRCWLVLEVFQSAQNPIAPAQDWPKGRLPERQ